MPSSPEPSALPEVPTPSRRRLLGGAAVGVTTMWLPVASAAASASTQTLACATPSFTAVPFLAEGASTIVGDVRVTATTNGGKDGSGLLANSYRHDSSDAVRRTVLTFSPSLTAIQFTTAYHADGGGLDVQEVYTLTGETLPGGALFTQSITNQDTTLEPSGSGTFSPGLARLTIEFSGIEGPGYTGATYASLILIRMLTCP